MFRDRRLLTGILMACSASALASAPTAKSESGLLPYLYTAFVGGLVSLLTPCVFPMIPVTVSYFSKQQSPTWPKALAYALGIISNFAIFGIAASVLFGATGISNFAANPWVNLVIGLIFVVLALNLFGLFEIALPSGLVNNMSRSSRKSGLVGPFFMGATFALTSFTCTAPIAASLLAAAAKGAFFYPAVGMAAYGLAFALPFYLLALFPQTMSNMPKSGNWLSAVKPVLAFIELAAAMKFFSNADLGFNAGLITRPVFLASWVIIFGAMALYLIGLPKSVMTIGWVRRSFAVLTMALTGYLAMGFKGDLGELNAYMPPDPYPGREKVVKTIGNDGPILAMNYQDALAKAKESHRPVFIDFTGVNCVNCRWMEKNMFSRQDVTDEFKGFVKVQLWTDRPNPDDQANQKLQGTLAKNQALPTYVLLSPEGKVIDKFEGATRQSSEFINFLKKAKSPTS
ncbi:MAG: thioredoxin family protein [Armatimonadetes bacterium]|nr:thioredoxin family protein [Armatimonadota bacterium]